MNRPLFDQMSDREQKQNLARINEFMGQQMSLQRKRKLITGEIQKLESEVENESTTKTSQRPY